MRTISMPRAVSYIRVSTEQQADSGLGLEARATASPSPRGDWGSSSRGRSWMADALGRALAVRICASGARQGGASKQRSWDLTGRLDPIGRLENSSWSSCRTHPRTGRGRPTAIQDARKVPRSTRPHRVVINVPGGSVCVAAKVWGVSKTTAAKWISKDAPRTIPLTRVAVSL
jgi:hypothetical protein